MDRDGLLYALHRDRGEIAVFDTAGAFVRWIRRGRGEGPGEFTFPARMGFAGDTLWVRAIALPLGSPDFSKTELT